MAFSRPSAGDEAGDLALSAKYHSALVDMLNAYLRGTFTQDTDGPSDRAGYAIDNGNGTGEFEEGELVSLDLLPSVSSSFFEAAKNPVSDASQAVWHTSIGNVSCLQDTLIAGGTVGGENRTVGLVQASKTVGVENQHWLMVDPDNTKRLKSASSGIYKVLTWFGDDYAFADFTKSQPLWRYELTENSNGVASTTAAKLLCMDGTEYAASINLSDAEGVTEGQLSGDTGHCIHTGNYFYAIGGCGGDTIDVVTDVILANGKLCFCRKRVKVCSQQDLPPICINLKPC